MLCSSYEPVRLSLTCEGGLVEVALPVNSQAADFEEDVDSSYEPMKSHANVPPMTCRLDKACACDSFAHRNGISLKSQVCLVVCVFKQSHNFLIKALLVIQVFCTAWNRASIIGHRTRKGRHPISLGSQVSEGRSSPNVRTAFLGLARLTGFNKEKSWKDGGVRTPLERLFVHLRSAFAMGRSFVMIMAMQNEVIA